MIRVRTLLAKKLILAADLEGSAQALADAMGVARSRTLLDIARGTHEPTPDTERRIAAYFGVTPSSVVAWRDCATSGMMVFNPAKWRGTTRASKLSAARRREIAIGARAARRGRVDERQLELVWA